MAWDVCRKLDNLGHSWRSIVAIMRGRYLLGLSNANRTVAGLVTGDEVEVELELNTEPPVVTEPADFAAALDADPAARGAWDRLAYSRKREHLLATGSAKKPETCRPSQRAQGLAQLGRAGGQQGHGLCDLPPESGGADAEPSC